MVHVARLFQGDMRFINLAAPVHVSCMTTSVADMDLSTWTHQYLVRCDMFIKAGTFDLAKPPLLYG